MNDNKIVAALLTIATAASRERRTGEDSRSSALNTYTHFLEKLNKKDEEDAAKSMPDALKDLAEKAKEHNK